LPHHYQSCNKQANIAQFSTTSTAVPAWACRPHEARAGIGAHAHLVCLPQLHNGALLLSQHLTADGSLSRGSRRVTQGDSRKRW
jgi:hypothetical protein